MTGKPVVYLIRTSVIKKERFISFRADDLQNGRRVRNVYFLIIARRANMRTKPHYFVGIFFLLVSKYNLILMFGVLPRFRFIYGFHFSYFFFFFLKFNLLASFIARETTGKKKNDVYVYIHKNHTTRSQKI